MSRVFFHEIGHFIAQELNYKLFKVGLGTEKIWIESKRFSNKIDYCGGVRPKKPVDYVDDGEIRKPIHYISNIIYGCIIQTLYLKSKEDYKFHDCFDYRDDANGKSDVEHFASTGKYFDGKIRKKVIEFIKNIYISRLENDKNHLKKLFLLEPTKFIITSKTRRKELDLNLLRESMSDFLVEHEEH
ncbi:MAG: hypothetical protein KGV59_04670 [Tenacibaculum sp.]|nr:hypothetical protein [Tenacibaculum sp.]